MPPTLAGGGMLFSGSGHQVRWIAAQAMWADTRLASPGAHSGIVALVVDMAATWNRSVRCLPGNPVSATSVESPVHFNLRGRPRPRPARQRATGAVHERRELFRTDLSQHARVAGPVQSVIMSCTQVTSDDGPVAPVSSTGIAYPWGVPINGIRPPALGVVPAVVVRRAHLAAERRLVTAGFSAITCRHRKNLAQGSSAC